MSARMITFAAIGTLLSVLLKLRLSMAAGGTTVSVPLPALLVAALVLASAAVAWMCMQALRGFRSSPYPRTVSNWSA